MRPVGVALRAVVSRAREAARWGAPAQTHLLLWVVAVTLTFTATAYGPPWDSLQGSGTTATGIKLAPGPTARMTGPFVVAVDPSVVPLGTKLKINPNPFGDPNIVFTAADTGGAIKGNRIDFYDPLGRAHQYAWGSRPVSVSVLGKGSPSSASSGPAPTATGSAPGSSSGPSEWLKLLLDAVFVGFGAIATVRGVKQLTARPG